MNLAVKRIVWGKMINLGQTCVAPDYVLCSSSVQNKMIPMIKQVMEEFFGNEREKCSDLCRIVSDRHYQRLKGLIDRTKGNFALQGKCIESERFIDLHVVTEVAEQDPVMQAWNQTIK